MYHLLSTRIRPLRHLSTRAPSREIVKTAEGLWTSQWPNHPSVLSLAIWPPLSNKWIGLHGLVWLCLQKCPTSATWAPIWHYRNLSPAIWTKSCNSAKLTATELAIWTALTSLTTHRSQTKWIYNQPTSFHQHAIPYTRSKAVSKSRAQPTFSTTCASTTSETKKCATMTT